jgi:hypothetical protein
MNAPTPPAERKNLKTGMTLAEMKEFVNRKNLRIGDVNFSPEMVD